MKYWFIFCKTDILLEKREDGTYTIPCSEESPVATKPWTHILNITPMNDGTEVKTFTIPEPVTDNPKYEMCGLRPSFYKLSPELYQKAGKCQELNYWDMNTQFCGVCGSPMKMSTDISKKCTECGKSVWPSLATAIIVLIKKGDQVLLVTDPFGKTASSIMDYLLSDVPFDETECAKLIHGRVKASNEEIFDSIRGFEILSEQRFKMSHAKQHMELLSSYMDDIETELFRLSRSYDEVIKRISGIVGFTERSALFVISEIGADMGVFESAKHLCSWAGLTPANNESANKKKSTRCSKAGQYLKPLLIQCALAAVKSKKILIMPSNINGWRKGVAGKKQSLP